MVEAGANVNVFDKEKQTPLHIATEQGNFECVQYLVEHGADVNAISEKYTPRSVLLIAEMKEQVAIVRFLLEHGANPNVLNLQLAFTPLMYALIYQPNNQPLIKMLLDYCADPNLSNNAVGTTPIMFAAAKGQPENVQLFIDAGADVNATEQDGSTALMWILTYLENEEEDQKRLSCTRLLLEHGIDVNAVDSRGGNRVSTNHSRIQALFCKSFVRIWGEEVISNDFQAA